jgi:cobalt-zinc-cadmium efflux system protein
MGDHPGDKTLTTTDTHPAQKRFLFSILLTGLILVAEIVGGLVSGSLALLSDAAHVFSDIFALGLSYFALRLATRPPDDQHSYGWHRTEVIAALINGASLLVIAIGIWVEAIQRWQTPVEIKSTTMLIIAVIGLVVNIIVAIILGGHGHHAHEHSHAPSKGEKRNLNVQSAYLHVLGDLISSIGVIIAALLIRLTSARWIDPLISILIGAIILVSAYRVLKSALHILIEGVPAGLSVNDIRRSISALEDVDTIHDLHVWNLGSEEVSLSAHVVLNDANVDQQAIVMKQIKEVLSREFGIEHTTLQFEQTRCGEGHGGCN